MTEKIVIVDIETQAEPRVINTRVILKKEFKDQSISEEVELCSCGCGRPKGRNKRFLSDYCFRHSGEEAFPGKRNHMGNKKGMKP